MQWPDVHWKCPGRHVFSSGRKAKGEGERAQLRLKGEPVKPTSGTCRLPQSRSSELSPQSLSLSHSQVPGTHCPLSQRNSLSEQGLGTARRHQEHIQQSMNSDIIEIVPDKSKETCEIIKKKKICILPDLVDELRLSKTRIHYTNISNKQDKMNGTRTHSNPSHPNRRRSRCCRHTATVLECSDGCHTGNLPEDHRSRPLFVAVKKDQ